MWKNVILKEVKSLHKNDTWELLELPKRKKVTGCKWVFAKKHESRNDKIVHYKAKLIAKGYVQKEGIDHNEIFSHVVKHFLI